MTEAALNARREYLRAWRKANPDKVKRYSETFWERKVAAQQTEKKTEVKRDVSE